MKAIELSGRIDNRHKRRLDTARPPWELARVRVIICIPEDEPGESARLPAGGAEPGHSDVASGRSGHGTRGEAVDEDRGGARVGNARIGTGGHQHAPSEFQRGVSCAIRSAVEHGHARADARNLHLHRLALEKIRANPSLRRACLDLADRWLSAPRQPASPLLARWREMLEDWPLDRIADVVLDPEGGQALRQASPLAPALTPQERWAALAELEGGDGGRPEPSR